MFPGGGTDSKPGKALAGLGECLKSTLASSITCVANRYRRLSVDRSQGEWITTPLVWHRTSPRCVGNSTDETHPYSAL